MSETARTPSATDEPSRVPLQNRWWLQVIVLVVALPLGIVLTAAFTAYRWKSGKPIRVGKIAKFLVTLMITVLWLVMLPRITSSDAIAEAMGHTAGRIYFAIFGARH